MPDLWTKKLAAWLHDPAEKALVLMRDEVGHEHGSVAGLRERLGIARADFDKRADWLAAAADRPQWPFEPGKPRPPWANVRWAERPVLIHPLSGEEIDLGKLGDDPARAWREVSFDHFDELIVRAENGTPDLRLTYLAFWRFGPTPPAKEIGALWQMLPADTRVPDHSIWQHLDAVSALAGALHEDEPALLTLSIGPVQGFIAQARSTSDLWAGSHLLACLAWEAMLPIVEALGPDAILFPSLRGVPLVDLWLLEQHPHWRSRFESEGLLTKKSDESPLFSAALPNKFTAIVPRSRAAALAQAATEAVRTQARAWAIDAAAKVFEAADRSGEHWRQQVHEQLAGFPEVQWVVADWPAALGGEAALRAALGVFYPEERTQKPGFFDEPVWKVLSSEKALDGVKFFEPNAGALYPAVYELADRALAATKAARSFDARVQRGFRCTVTGEHEWLTDALDYNEANKRAPTVLDLASNARATIHHGDATGTVWYALSEKKPSWARRGEHLGALATLKRLWPTLFCERIKQSVGLDVRRLVVSTHALALATSLEQLAARGAPGSEDRLMRLAAHVATEEDDALLPSSLAASLRRSGNPELLKIARKLPVALDRLREDRAALEVLEGELARLLGHRHETYYGVIQMDGDRLGAWLAGNDADTRLRFRETWHPQVQAAIKQFENQPALKEYFESFRPASPARHAYVSAALNHFSLHVARHIVEVIGKGRLIYSGGDDVLALVAVDDLLPVMLLLRAAYSGWGQIDKIAPDLKGLEIGRGYVRLQTRLLPAMGAKATASIGAVVAHHTAPLAHVLRRARDAEKSAKGAGRNAFCLRVMKRGGGEVGVVASFRDRLASAGEAPRMTRTPAGYMLRLADALDATEFSRRAIFAACEWLAGLPPRPHGDDAWWREMTATLLARQFKQQQGLEKHAHEAVEIACNESAPDKTPRFLADLLVSAEFFARQGRSR